MKRLRAWAEKDGRGYPDWALRYLPVVRRLAPWLMREGVVLEIGANANGVARFARRPVVAVDISMQSLRECRSNPHALPVRADIAALPFADNSVVACVCMDTFEHLPDALREVASREITRVLRHDGAGVVGFPTGAAAAAAEARVQEACFRYTGARIRWLEEHATNGLPDAAGIAARLRQLAAPSHLLEEQQNTNLHVWEWTWRVLMCGWPGRGNALAQAALRVLTPLLARIHCRPCYRALLLIFPRDTRHG